MADNLIERLRRLDTPAVSDALDRLKRTGVIMGLAALSAPRRICGAAVTVQLGPASESQSAARHLCTAAVEAGGPGSVIVIAHEGRTDVAGWGGLLSLGAARRRIEAVIIDGACRDIDESRELDLTIYGRAVVPVTARGRIVEKSWNEPVRIGGVGVEPGDLVIADGSGVASIRRDEAQEVISLAEQIVAREQTMAAAVRAGKSMTEVMDANYETMFAEAVVR